MSQRKRVPQKRPAVSKKKPTQYSESESDHHEKQEIDNLITSYEQQMKKRNLKRKQSEPDYKMLMTALYDESLDALKSCETRLKSALSRLSVEHLSKPNSRQINATMNASFETLEALVHHLDLDLETRQMQWDKRAMNRQQLGNYRSFIHSSRYG